MQHEIFKFEFKGVTEALCTDNEIKKSRAVVTCLKDIKKGERIRLIAGGFHNLLCRMATYLWELEEVICFRDIEIVSRPPASWSELWEAGRYDVRQVFCLSEVEASEDLPVGSSIVFCFNHRFGDDGIWSKRLGYIRAEHGVLDVEQKVFVYMPWGVTYVLHRMESTPVKVEIRIKAQPERDGLLTATIFRTDARFNPVHNDEGTVKLTARGLLNVPEEISWSTARQGRILLTGIKHCGEGVGRITVIDSLTGTTCISNAALPLLPGGLNRYFGDLHFHSNISPDGSNPMFSGYQYGRDILNLDFLAEADHNPEALQWPEYLFVNELFNVPGEFVTIPAWEEGCTESRYGGHLNVYLKHPSAGCAPSKFTGSNAQDKFAWDWPEDVIVGPHGTNLVDDGHKCRLPEPEICSSRYKLFEIIQHRGSSESNEPDKIWGISPKNYPHSKGDSSARRALEMGHKLAFIGGTDNHQAMPTVATFQGEYVGMTCILADKLTRAALFNAMENRQTYATSGVPILMNFTVDGHPMGSIIPANVCGEHIKLSIEVFGTNSIRHVQVISNGNCCLSFDGCGLDFTETIELDKPDMDSWFYVRVLQHDGYRAWTSPIWLCYT